MSPTMMKTLCVLTGIALAACAEDGGERCEVPGDVRGEIVSQPVREPVTAAIEVRGMLTVPADVTVYQVLVNGFAATDAGKNFSSWNATIPTGVLAGAVPPGTDEATLVAYAITNCGAPIEVGRQTMRVDLRGIDVTELELATVMPTTETYVPAGGAVTVQLNVTANKEAVGALVKLTAKSGTISPPQFNLVAGAEGKAVGQASFAPGPAGQVVIEAKAGNLIRTSIVRVAGPPTFAPDDATIDAGSSLRTTVLTGGRISACWATPQLGMRVTSGANSDLMSGAGGIDQTMDGLVDIDVAADATVAAMAQTVVSCRDPFNQVGSATFRARAAPVPPTTITSLALAAAFPNGQTFLPSSRPVSALVTITGNPQATGATVMLAATGGTVTPPQVTLTGNGVGNSVAYAMFSSTLPGTAVVTATAPGHSQSLVIPVQGPPTFAPDGVALAPGGRVRVTVLGSGVAGSCQAAPHPAFTITSGPANLMAAPGGADLTADGLVDIDVEAATTITGAVQTTLSCRDPHGQVGTATFTAAPQ